LPPAVTCVIGSPPAVFYTGKSQVAPQLPSVGEPTAKAGPTGHCLEYGR
jgi:hypothetical protein